MGCMYICIIQNTHACIYENIHVCEPNINRSSVIDNRLQQCQIQSWPRWHKPMAFLQKAPKLSRVTESSMQAFPPLHRIEMLFACLLDTHDLQMHSLHNCALTFSMCIKENPLKSPIPMPCEIPWISDFKTTYILSLYTGNAFRS